MCAAPAWIGCSEYLPNRAATPYHLPDSLPQATLSFLPLQGLLTVLTPVYPDSRTLGLLRNQLHTFATFADVESFAAWVLVAPADKVPALRAFLDAELPDLPPALDDTVSVHALLPLTTCPAGGASATVWARRSIVAHLSSAHTSCCISQRKAYIERKCTPPAFLLPGPPPSTVVTKPAGGFDADSKRLPSSGKSLSSALKRQKCPAESNYFSKL